MSPTGRENSVGARVGVLCCVLLLTVFSSSINALSISAAQSDSINRLFKMPDSTGQITWIDRYDEGTPTYFAASFKTIQGSVEQVQKVLESFTQYASSFKYIERSDSVTAPEVGKPVYYWQIRALFARAWFLADLDTAGSFGSGGYFARIVQNRDAQLNAHWSGESKRRVSIGMNDYLMFWLVEPIDSRRCRVGLVAKLKPKAQVPLWLYKMAGRRVFPRFITDIERALEHHD